MLLPWATLALAQVPPQDFSLQMFSVPGEMENFSSFLRILGSNQAWRQNSTV